MKRFVVQLHDATTLHYDFRLQVGRVMRSWAVPKGPSLDPAHRRLAVPVPDHPMSWNKFEGITPGPRGSGAVIIWDEGTVEGLERADLDNGHASFVLHGSKLRGGFALTQTGPKSWLLIKKRDDEARPGYDVVKEQPESVKTGRRIEEV